jgi:hypothetical protein
MDINRKYYGSIYEEEIVKEFYKISFEVDKIILNVLEKEYNFETNSYEYIMKELLKYSFETSQSLRLILSHSIIRSAYALLRVRLEQMIVSSYLIHSDKKEGLDNFILHSGISLYKNYSSTASFSNFTKETMDKFLSAVGVNEKYYKDLANLAQKEKRSEFRPETDKYDRDWTSLDLRSMAKKRDEFVNENRELFSTPIEYYYSSLYKGGNSVIHSDAIIASSSFFPSMNSMWYKNLALNNSYFDMVQGFEISKFLGLDFKKEFTQLNEEYFLNLKGSLGSLF